MRLLLASALFALPLIAPAAAMEFRTASTGEACETCIWIAADGEITAETASELEAFLAANPGAGSLVAFHSPGGLILEGLRLGSLIRSRGLWTTIGQTVEAGGHQRLDAGICASACSYAFLGGVRRFADEGEFGVHQFYFESDNEPAPPPEAKDTGSYQTTETGFSQTLLGAVLVYLLRMGASPEILAVASNMNPESLHFFTADELVAMRVTTESEPAPEWMLALAGDGIEARRTVDRSWLAQTDIRLYCEGERRLLAYHVALHGRPGDLVASIAQNVGRLRFRLGDATIVPKVESFAFDGERAALDVLFALEDKDFERVAGAAEIAADLGNLPPAARSSFELFYAKLPGDPKAPLLALRNCVG